MRLSGKHLVRKSVSWAKCPRERVQHQHPNFFTHFSARQHYRCLPGEAVQVLHFGGVRRTSPSGVPIWDSASPDQDNHATDDWEHRP